VTRVNALVLAGRRRADDPFAASFGAQHRALVPVAGTPSLVRVIRALRETPSVARICISIDDQAALDAIPELRAQVESGALELRQSLASPSRSVLDALESGGLGTPLLVTTADHALLTPAMLSYFTARSQQSGADLSVGVVAASLLSSRYPQTQRTYVRLRGEAWTGANLFCFLSERATPAARFWRRVEHQRKQPWRLASAFGPWLLVRFALRRLDLDAALAGASRRIGAALCALPLPFPEAGIDVDRPADLALAEYILAGAPLRPADARVGEQRE
jgi:GTP:adenosylcobinamide-phosphate guanylyltransferase